MCGNKSRIAPWPVVSSSSDRNMKVEIKINKAFICTAVWFQSEVRQQFEHQRRRLSDFNPDCQWWRFNRGELAPPAGSLNDTQIPSTHIVRGLIIAERWSSLVLFTVSQRSTRGIGSTFCDHAVKKHQERLRSTGTRTEGDRPSFLKGDVLDWYVLSHRACYSSSQRREC